jgi:hypothetical protein
MAAGRSMQVAALLAVSLVGLVGPARAASALASSQGSGRSVDAACRNAVESVVSATQRYVRAYELGRAVSATPGTAGGTPTSTPGNSATTPDEFQAAIDHADQVIRKRRCSPASVQRQLKAGLARVSAEGPVADAVLRQLTASMTGRIERGSTAVRPAPGEDLRDVVARTPERAVVELATGDYHLDASLVLLSGVVIRGAGTDATTIVSEAPEAAVLVLTDRRVELADLTVRRAGAAPGSVVVAGQGSSVVVNRARFIGGKTDTEGQGGAGILMFGVDRNAAGRGTTLEVTDVEVRDNEAAGILLTGGHRSSIVNGTFRANGQCGVCFLGNADGSVENSTFEDNGVGIAVTGTAAPTLLRLVMSGGTVGVQAADAAAPAIEDVTISHASRAAMIYTGSAAGSLNRVSCDDVPFGIVVGPDVRARVGTTNCRIATGP